MIVILISGASSSGKTSLSERLLDALRAAGRVAELIVMDSYFKEIPEDREINEYRVNTNFDRCCMYELDMLNGHIIDLNTGKTIPKFAFEFATNKRKIDGAIPPPDFLIIEGLFAMQLKAKLPESVAKLTVAVETSSYLTIVKRRIARDVEQRGRTSGEVIRQERKYVGAAFFSVITRDKHNIDVSVVNDDVPVGAPHPLEKGVDEILASLGVVRAPVAAASVSASSVMAMK